MHSKKNSVDTTKQRLIIDMAGGEGKKKGIISKGGDARSAVNSPKHNAH